MQTTSPHGICWNESLLGCAALRPFTFSEDAQFHFGLEDSVKIANAYPHTPLILGHWGTVDAPDFAPFNGDPQHLLTEAVNPGRIQVLAPGQPFKLKRLQKA